MLANNFRASFCNLEGHAFACSLPTSQLLLHWDPSSWPPCHVYFWRQYNPENSKFPFLKHTSTCMLMVKIKLEFITLLTIFPLKWFTKYFMSQWLFVLKFLVRVMSLFFFGFWYLLGALRYPFIPDLMSLNKKLLHLCQPIIRLAPYLSCSV